jgi:hypothetical protein
LNDSHLGYQGVQRVPELMRDCSVHQREELLLSLDLAVKDFVRDVNDLKEHPAASVVLVLRNLELHILEPIAHLVIFGVNFKDLVA